MPISKYDGTTDPLLHVCCVCNEDCSIGHVLAHLDRQPDESVHIYSGHEACINQVEDFTDLDYRIAYRSENGQLTW